ncbi:SRPBCC family protein [Gordonia westfalica]|uniref:Polyketide cyclase / dehydrase and lipid transport n=1 Tax=Gordonia westfalica TaxID=158898 RepID=A0A1H2JN07_9ACTN|nr:SRPBCC family protein [Gordonia westfalica]MDS1115830.1 SRPBCC family protein [Gordonia westfalica]SDU57723.1 Polyketide cyclase / dehydrase and lipid transport [Gordonia westfalica]
MADTFTFTRSIVVDAPPAAILPYLTDFRQWVHWSPWEGLDPDLHREYSGAESGVGAKYAWSGNKKAGRGAMEITRVDAPREVEVRLDFEKPMKATNTVTFELTPQGEATRVAWVMVGKHTLFSRIGGLFGFFEKMLGKDFEKGLAQLKAVSESR